MRSVRVPLVTLALALCMAVSVSAAIAGASLPTQGNESGTIEDAESGILLDYTVQGGSNLTVTDDGGEHRIEGTARPGETISIAASGHGTTWTGRHHVNEDLEASLSIWFDGSDVNEMTTIAPGSSGSLSASFVVSGDTRSVRGGVMITNAWINPYGGGSQTLRLAIDLDVVEPTTSTTTPSTPAPEPPDPSDESCDEKLSGGTVRFGDLHGEVNVRPNCEDDDAYVFAELGTPLYHDYRIRTLPRSGAILSFSDMSSFVMREDSTIVLDILNERDGIIGHLAGNVWINLNRMIKDGSMEVEMSQAVAGIKGTTLATEETGTTSTVKVFEGIVEVRPNEGAPVDVGSGQMIVVTDGVGGPITDFDVTAELAKWDETVQRMTTEAMLVDVGGQAVRAPLVVGIALVGLVAAGVSALVQRQIRSKHRHQNVAF